MLPGSLKRSVALSIAFSYLVPALCALSIRINWVTSCTAIIVGVWLIQPAIVASGVLATVLIRVVNGSAPTIEDIPERLIGLLPIDDRLPSNEAVELEKICSKVGVARNKLTLLTDLGSNQLTPAIRRNLALGFDVIIPASFFAQWQRHPHIAYAVLSHEIGHILQRDVDLGVIVRRYAKYMLKRVLVMEFLAVLAAAVAVTYFAPETAQQLERKNWSFLTLGTAWDSVTAAQNLATGVSLLALVSAVVTALSVLMFLIVIVLTPIFAIRSESVCDRVALYVTGEVSIRRALEWISGENSNRRASILFRFRQKVLSLARDTDKNPVWLTRWMVARFAVFSLTGVVGIFTLAFPATPYFWELAQAEYNFWPLWTYNRPEPKISPDGNWTARYDPWNASIEIAHTGSRRVSLSFTPINQPTINEMTFEFDPSSRVLFVWSESGVEAFNIESGVNLGQLTLNPESPDFLSSMISTFKVSSKVGDDTLVVGFGDGEVASMSYNIYPERIDLKPISQLETKGHVRDLELLEPRNAYAVLVDGDDTPDDRKASVALFDGTKIAFQAQLPPIRGIASIAVSSDGRWIAFSGMEAVGAIAVPSGIVSRIAFFGLNPVNNTPPSVMFVPGTYNLISKANFDSPFDSRLAIYVPVRNSDGSIHWQKDVGDTPARTSLSGSRSTGSGATQADDFPGMASTNLPVRDERITAISTSPSGRFLASLHADGIVRIWRVDYTGFGPGSLIATFSIGSARCIALVGDDELIWEDENGRAKSHVISASGEMAVSTSTCRLSDPQRTFYFSGSVFSDSSNGVSVDINESIEGEIKEIRRVNGSNDAAEYLINHTDGERIGIWKISVVRRRLEWSLNAFLSLVASAYFVAEVMLLLLRLHRRKESGGGH